MCDNIDRSNIVSNRCRDILISWHIQVFLLYYIFSLSQRNKHQKKYIFASDIYSLRILSKQLLYILYININKNKIHWLLKLPKKNLKFFSIVSDIYSTASEIIYHLSTLNIITKLNNWHFRYWKMKISKSSTTKTTHKIETKI